MLENPHDVMKPNAIPISFVDSKRDNGRTNSIHPSATV